LENVVVVRQHGSDRHGYREEDDATGGTTFTGAGGSLRRGGILSAWPLDRDIRTRPRSPMRPFLTGLWQRRRAVLFYAVLLALGWMIGLGFQNVNFLETRDMNEPMIRRMVMMALVA